MARKFVRGLIGGVAVLAIAAVWSMPSANANSTGLTNQAQSNTSVTIPISSTVATECTIVDSSSGTQSVGDLSTKSDSNVTIASIVETCNDPAGYNVTLSSLNSGSSGTSFFLKGSLSSNTTQIPYTLTYNTNPVSLASGVATITTATAPTAASGTSAKLLAFSANQGNYPSDTYSDTLTLTMAVN